MLPPKIQREWEHFMATVRKGYNRKRTTVTLIDQDLAIAVDAELQKFKRLPDDKNHLRREVYTTGQAAKIAGVSQQTIIRACDAEDLVSFKVPVYKEGPRGTPTRLVVDSTHRSGHRKIRHEDLCCWMRRRAIPMRFSEPKD